MAILQFQNGPVVAAISEPIPLDIEQVGPRGPKGWTPVIVGVPDGGRKVLLLADWTGGAAPKPATGYIGPAGLVADIANAVDFAGRGLTNVTQDQDANLVINYNDDSTDIIPAYFAPMLAAAAEVDADAQAVELSRQAVVNIQADVVTRQSQINDTKVANDVTKIAIDAKAVEVESKRVEVNSVTAQAANIVFNGSTDFPTVAPAFYWHCDQGELDPRVDLTYTGNLSVTDHRGVQRAVPQGARALDYNPLTRACLGFPIWEGRTNLFTNSTNVEGWGYAYLTATTDPAEKAPDGSSAVYFTDSGINSTHHIRKNSLQAFSTVYTFSVYCKAKSPVSIFKMIALLDTTTAAVTFNLSTLVVTNGGPGYISSSLTPVGNGWYRASITYTSGASGTNNYIDVRVCNSGGAENYTPDGTNSIYFWGPQFEAGAFATPYIPTSGPAVARGAINAKIQGLAFQQFYNTADMTIVCEFTYAVQGTDTYIWRLGPDANFYMSLRKVITNNSLRLIVRPNGQSAQDFHIVDATAGTLYRVAVRMKAGAFAASVNGAACVLNTGPYVSTGHTDLQLGSYISAPLNGINYRELAVYGPGISDAQLQALSRI